MAKFNDWFGRNKEDHYTKYDRSKRSVNWEKGYDNYSDYFFGRQRGDNVADRVEQAAELITTMATVVGADKSKFSNTKSEETILIPTNLLRTSKNVDVFLGAALQNISAKVNTTPQERRNTSSIKAGNSFLSAIHSILNSERLNDIMAEETPGYLKFVQKYKEHTFNKDRPKPNPENKAEVIIDLFDRIIRYPENIDDAVLEEYKEGIESVRELLSEKGGIPRSYRECTKTSQEITEILKKYIEEKEEEEEEKKKDKGEGGKNKGGSKGATEPSTDYIESLVESFEEDDTQDDDVFNRLRDKIEELEEGGSKISKNVEFIKYTESLEASTEFERAKKKINFSKASVIRNLLKRKNRDYQFALKSMKSGRLDTNKLAEAKQKVSTIYERMGEVKTNKLCVTILVDQSGSMSGRRIEKARQAAIFLCESLKGVKDVELFIYGHTADTEIYQGGKRISNRSAYANTQILVYNEKGYSPSSKIMGHMEAMSQNRDGVAMLAVAKRVRKQTTNNGIFICISDGNPSAHGYGGLRAQEHVKKTALQIEKMGFQVIQVAIDGYRSKDMFKNVINMNDMSTFPMEFAAFLKTKIDHMIKEKITV